MKQKALTLIGLSIILSLSIVLGLYVSANKKINYQYSSFTRNFVKNFIQPLDTLDIKYNSYYIAGVTSSHMYLGNTIAPSHLLTIDIENLDTIYTKLKMPKIRYKSIRLTVDSPYFYLADGTRPFIYKGHFSNWQATSYLDSVYFTNIVPISNRSLGLVAVNNKENVFYKANGNKFEINIFRNLLKEQGDGLFSTDGKLYHDKKLALLVYVYYYRNQYVCMDTNFNFIFEGNTIDTISHAKIKVRQINSNNSITMAAPPLMVNKNCHISNGQLYVNSNLLAKNEDIKTFEQNTAIDVYDLLSKKYRVSFYIPPYKGEKAKSFVVINNSRISALYNHSIVIYKLGTTSD